MSNMKCLIAAGAVLLATAGVVPAASADDGLLAALLGAGLGAGIGHRLGGRDGAWVGGVVGAATGAALADDRRGYRSGDDYRQSRYYAAPPVVVYRPRPVYVALPPRLAYRDGDGYRREERHEFRERREYRRQWPRDDD